MTAAKYHAAPRSLLSVIPAKAGIPLSFNGFRPTKLDPSLRWGDGTVEEYGGANLSLAALPIEKWAIVATLRHVTRKHSPDSSAPSGRR